MCLRIIYEIPDYEIVIRITHAVDNGKLIFGAFHIVINASRGRRYLKSLLKSLVCKICKIFGVILIAFRNFINRKMNGLKIIFRMTHISDLTCILDSLGKLREKASHLCL